MLLRFTQFIAAVAADTSRSTVTTGTNAEYFALTAYFSRGILLMPHWSFIAQLRVGASILDVRGQQQQGRHRACVQHGVNCVRSDTMTLR